MKNASAKILRPVSIKTVAVKQAGPLSPSRPLPASNQSPCQCTPPKGDRIGGLPDKVLRPVRKEVDVSSIKPSMSYSNKGYVKVAVGRGN